MLACAATLAAGLAVSSSAWANWAVAGGGSGATNGFPCTGMVGHSDGMGGSTFDCSGTVVGNGMFVLTARHCLDGIADPQNARFSQNGVTYFGQEIMRHPTADIAIIKLGVMLSDSYPVACPATLTGLQFCGVGFGVGSSNGGTATSTWDLPYGTKRVFYNVIDGLSPDGGLNGERAFEYSLTIPGGIAGEGVHGPGDSGGPMLSNINGTVSVVGVLSYARGTAGPRPGLVAGGPPIDEWTKSRVPAPSGLGLLAGSVLVVARRRR
jgi:hypothetical protein